MPHPAQEAASYPPSPEGPAAARTPAGLLDRLLRRERRSRNAEDYNAVFRETADSATADCCRFESRMEIEARTPGPSTRQCLKPPASFAIQSTAQSSTSASR